MAPKIGTVFEPRTPDLKGQRFGRLLVIERLHHVDKRGRSRWLWRCLCDCGTRTLTYPFDLNRTSKRHKVSCGCHSLENNRHPIGEAAFRRLFNKYRYDANVRHLEFTLDEDYFKALTRGNCHYCNKPPSREYGSARTNGRYKYNGIDRVINDLGYVSGNVVSCCYICNRGKSTLEYEEWINHCKQVAATHTLDLSA